MGDLIRRQEAIAEFSCCELTPDGGIDVNYAIEFLGQLPSEQPEITCCKDCKFTDGEKPIADGRYWCVLHGSFMYFCSDAERREE